MIGLTRSEENMYYATTTDGDRRALQLASADQFEELKKVVILSGIFFMATIVLILSKLQVPTEDVLRWAPIVWLIGVIIAGIFMNIFFKCRKLLKDRRQKRLREQHDLLQSLALPASFPCLAPGPHHGCCRAPQRREGRKASLPSYEQVVTKACDDKSSSSPPDYHAAVAMLRENRGEGADSQRQRSVVDIL